MHHLILTKFIRETSMEAIHSNCGATIPAGMIMVMLRNGEHYLPDTSKYIHVTAGEY